MSTKDQPIIISNDESEQPEDDVNLSKTKSSVATAQCPGKDTSKPIVKLRGHKRPYDLSSAQALSDNVKDKPQLQITGNNPDSTIGINLNIKKRSEVMEMKKAFDEGKGLSKTIFFDESLRDEDLDGHFGKRISRKKLNDGGVVVKSFRKGQKFNANEIIIPLELGTNNVERILAFKSSPGRLQIIMKDAGVPLNIAIHYKNFKRYFQKNMSSVCCSLFEIGSLLESRGICHRDIKPENICCQMVGGKITFVLIDFGSASETSKREEQSDHTPEYMTPGVAFFILVKMIIKYCNEWEKVNDLTLSEIMKTVHNLKLELTEEENGELSSAKKAFLERYITRNLPSRVPLYDSDPIKNQHQRNECFKGILQQVSEPRRSHVANAMGLSTDKPLMDYDDICKEADIHGLFKKERCDTYSLGLNCFYPKLGKHPIDEANHYTQQDFMIQRLITMTKIVEVEENVKYFKSVLKDFPEHLQTVLRNILCTPARDRWSSSDALAYLKAAGEPSSSKQPRLSEYDGHAGTSQDMGSKTGVVTKRIVEQPEDIPKDIQGFKNLHVLNVNERIQP